MDDHPPAPEALQAHLLRGVIQSTTPAKETAADGRLRAAIITEAFRALAPADVMEAMMACHVISLQFVYEGALRDLSAAAVSTGDEAEDAKAQARRRSQVNTLSRTLGQWLARYETTQTRREKREAGAREVEERAAISSDAKPDAPRDAPGNARRNEADTPIRPPERTPSSAPIAAQGRMVPQAAARPSPPVSPAAPQVNGHATPVLLAASAGGG